LDRFIAVNFDVAAWFGDDIAPFDVDDFGVGVDEDMLVGAVLEVINGVNSVCLIERNDDAGWYEVR